MSTAVDTDPQVDAYPSRTDDRPRLLDRQDPVAYGQEVDGRLSAAHLRRYDSLGYLFFERFFTSEELSPHLEELERLRSDPDIRSRAEVVTEPGSDEVRSVFAVHENNDMLSRLSRSPQLVAIARQLLGGDAYIHQSLVNYKPEFRGREFYWHSDFETWHVEDGMPRMRALSCSISLTDNHPANGPVLVIPGSHRVFLSCPGTTPENHYQKSLKKQEPGVPDDDSLRRMADDGGIETLAGAAGSVMFVDCNLMHGSASNISPWPRSNLFVAFNSVDNTLVEPYCGLEPRPQFIANRRDTAPLP